VNQNFIEDILDSKFKEENEKLEQNLNDDKMFLADKDIKKSKENKTNGI
jgi:hypothetical protein